MFSSPKYRKWFKEACAMKDDTDRSMAMEQIVLAAEEFYNEGNDRRAIYLFEKLMTLDSRNPLYKNFIETAETYLLKMDVIPPLSLDMILDKLEEEYKDLQDGDYELAIAKALFIHHSHINEAFDEAFHFFEQSEKFKPLDEKHKRMKNTCLKTL